MRIRTLIVDDEPPGVKAIRDLLDFESDIEIIGECFDGVQALQAIRRLKPDLVFLDIQMPGLDGFEVLEELSADELPLVIFVTAYDHYSLQAFAVHAVDYLLKPVGATELRASLDRVRLLMEGRQQQVVSQRLCALLEEVESRRPRSTRFVVREGERVLFLKAEDVEAIEATGNYMHLYSGKQSYMIRETLANLEERLDPAQFIRTHRSWMVNAERIKEVHPWNKGVYLLTVQGGTEVPVSRSYRDGIDRLIRGTLVE
jgi:two-component system LytT family response regulator